MSTNSNKAAIRSQIAKASNRISKKQYWTSDARCSHFAYDLKPYRYLAIYQRRFDLELNEAVRELPEESRFFYKYWVHAHLSYPTWAIACDRADRLLRELWEREIDLAYLLFEDETGKFLPYSEEYAELLISQWGGIESAE